MTELAFAPSEPLTLGIEEEFVLVDARDPLVVAPHADRILGGSWGTVASPGGWIKPELLRCSLELTTAASAGLVQLDVDLRALRDAAAERADDHGVRLVGIGMHPDLVVDDALITPSEAHRLIAELHQRAGTLAEQVTHGVHIHVGVPGLDEAVRVMEALAAHVPLLVACTANSPVVSAARAPWKSARSDVMRRLLWGGPAPHFSNASEYRAVHALHQLEHAGDQRFLWEVAPVPALGTVEVRAFDANPDPRVALAMAALVQAIAARVLDGERIERPNESLERHNRWSAMQFGPSARMLVPGRDTPVEAAELVRAAVEAARPHARSLGSERWLDVIDDLLEHPIADRVIASFESGGVAGVIDANALPSPQVSARLE